MNMHACPLKIKRKEKNFWNGHIWNHRMSVDRHLSRCYPWVWRGGNQVLAETERHERIKTNCKTLDRTSCLRSDCWSSSAPPHRHWPRLTWPACSTDRSSPLGKKRRRSWSKHSWTDTCPASGCRWGTGGQSGRRRRRSQSCRTNEKWLTNREYRRTCRVKGSRRVSFSSSLTIGKRCQTRTLRSKTKWFCSARACDLCGPSPWESKMLRNTHLKHLTAGYAYRLIRCNINAKPHHHQL